MGSVQVPWNLPTCVRCQKRKKKCDTILPGCANCSEDQTECVFYEQSTKTIIPRKTIQDLNEKVDRLQSELERLQAVRSLQSPGPQSNPPGFPQELAISRLSECRRSVVGGQWQEIAGQRAGPPSGHNALTITPFIGDGSIIDLCVATAGLVGLNVPPHTIPVDSAFGPSGFMLNNFRADRLDRSSIEPSVVNGLIDAYYFPVLHEMCPVIDRSQLEFNIRLKHMPLKKRLFVILTAAVAAAHRGRTDQSAWAMALMLRSWADDLLQDVLSQQDDDSLQALVLLIFYELMDPRRNLCWDLLGLACRTSVRLRWHRQRESALSDAMEQDMSDQFSRYPSSWKQRLFRIIYEWEWSVCNALQRPSIFSNDMVDPSPLAGVSSRNLYIDLMLRQSIRECSEQNCASKCEFVSLVNDNLFTSGDSDGLWLNVYLSVRHTWTDALRHNPFDVDWTNSILRAAVARINALFVAQRSGRIFSVWLSTHDVFTAGLVLLDISLRQPSATDFARSSKEWSTAVRRTSSLLAGFAELWKSARAYRDIFDAIADAAFA